MKNFNPLKCPDPDFATVESDQILTTEFAHNTLEDFSVLIDESGNVLTKGAS
jgi:hypothetical protein